MIYLEPQPLFAFSMSCGIVVFCGSLWHIVLRICCKPTPFTTGFDIIISQQLILSIYAFFQGTANRCPDSPMISSWASSRSSRFAIILASTYTVLSQIISNFPVFIPFSNKERIHTGYRHRRCSKKILDEISPLCYDPLG